MQIESLDFPLKRFLILASFRSLFVPGHSHVRHTHQHLNTPRLDRITAKVEHKYRPLELHGTTTEAPKQPDGIFSSLRWDQLIGGCGGQTLIMTASFSRTF